MSASSEDWEWRGIGGQDKERSNLRPLADYAGVVREIGVTGVLDDFDKPQYARGGCAVRDQ